MTVPIEGLKFRNNVINGTVAATPFYIAPFGIDYTFAPETDTGANFPANAGELTTEYNEATRQLFVPSAADATGRVTNSGNEVTFTFNAPVTVYGVALFTSSTKADGTDVLVDYIKLASGIPFVAADTFVVQYRMYAESYEPV